MPASAAIGRHVVAVGSGEGVERHQRAVELGELAAVASGSHADRREAETGHEFSGLLLA
jgi:hypothetical protein